MLKYYGEYKVPSGKLVIVNFFIEKKLFKEFSLSGDFFLDPENALSSINYSIEGKSVNSSRTQLLSYIKNSLPKNTNFIGFSPDSIISAIQVALGKKNSWHECNFHVIPPTKISIEMNIALDQVLSDKLSKNAISPTLRFWDWNSTSIVIGSFQSFQNEVNVKNLANSNISVVRRISGGGAMFMDPLKCITYSLYIPQTFVDKLSFEDSYLFLDKWIINALENINIKVFHTPLNDISTKKGKVGGSAQKRFANGVMIHQSTIAYDLNAKDMVKFLRIGEPKISDKGIRSAEKYVDPLCKQTKLTRIEIIKHLKNYFIDKYNAKERFITKEELDLASTFIESKFSNKNWTQRIR